MHLKPASGTPRPVGQAIVDHLFPPGDIGHIPLLGITGSKGKTTVARLLSRVLQLSDLYMGLAGRYGIFFGRWNVQKTDGATWSAATREIGCTCSRERGGRSA